MKLTTRQHYLVTCRTMHGIIPLFPRSSSQRGVKGLTDICTKPSRRKWNRITGREHCGQWRNAKVGTGNCNDAIITNIWSVQHRW